MKKFMLLLMVAFMMFAIVGCEDDDAEVSPLVGTWVMTDLVKDYNITMSDSVSMGAMGWLVPGDEITHDTTDWVTFDALGVNATIVMEEDETFTLTGVFGVANDTMFSATPIFLIPVQDAGVWVAPADMSTLLIDGSIYDLGGALTMDDPDNPTVISMYYESTDAGTLQFPSYSSPGTYIPLPVSNFTKTTIEFTKQ